MSGQKRFWLVNSGTTQDPWVSSPAARYRRWSETDGEVQGFSRRPASISVGDVLIHRAVGSPGNRLVAVAEVVGPPRDRPELRWRWRLPRRLLYVCSTLEIAPRAHEVGVDAHGMRTYKELAPDVGERAAARIAEAGETWT